MINTSPVYCLLAAALARTSLAVSVLWVLMALFSGQGNFITHPMWLVWIVSVLLFALNELMLKKERSMLFVIAADIVACIALTWIVYGFLSSDGPVVGFFMGMCAFIGAASQLFWYQRGFNDGELIMQMQFLLLGLLLQLAVAELMNKDAAWAGMTVLIIAALMLTNIFSRYSGISVEQNGMSTGLRAAVTCIAVVVLLGIIGAAAYILAGPVSEIALLGFEAGAAAGRGLMTAIGYIYIFLTGIFNSSKVSSPGNTGADAGGGNVYFGQATGDLDFVKVVFALILIVFIVVILIVLLDSLRKTMLSKMGGSIRRMNVQNNKKGFFGKWKEFFAGMVRKLRIKWMIMKHPGSVAALLIKLEKKCFKNNLFRKQEGETAREFIMRVSELTDDKEFSDILAVFADEVDAAFYGRETNYLREFTQHKKMLKTLKNSLTTRV